MDQMIMTPDMCMRFLVWSYYYHNIIPEPERSYASYGKFSAADAARLDELKQLLFKCFEVQSVNNACMQFQMAKVRNESCPFPQSELDAMFARELSFKVALFDLDGTLFDTEGQYSVFWGEMGRQYHPEIPNFDKVIKGTTLKQIYERYFPSQEVQDVITPQLIAFEAQMKYEFFPGVSEFIQDIRQHGVKTAVVTSSDQTKMNSVYRSMPNFKTYFDRILTAEDFSASKPNPDCYLKGAAVFDAPITDCVVFEDAFTGLQAGMSAGIYTIGIASGLTPEQIKDKCNHVILSFENMNYNSVVELLKK